eukprot:Amastigsp_a1709_28.p4 type:complete len:116 gc:universal Amastigsp_a1709_28:187-534(+)
MSSSVCLKGSARNGRKHDSMAKTRAPHPRCLEGPSPDRGSKPSHCQSTIGRPSSAQSRWNVLANVTARFSILSPRCTRAWTAHGHRPRPFCSDPSHAPPWRIRDAASRACQRTAQ